MTLLKYNEHGGVFIKAKVLVVDDNKDITDLIKIYLDNEGYETITASDGEEALKLAGLHEIQLVILDIMMPTIDGIEVCRRLRKISTVPILMLSAKSEDIDKILGLSTGADDYMSKPFNPLELVARVKSQIRRNLKYNSGITKSNNIMLIGNISIDKDRRRVEIGGEVIALTLKEYDILLYMATNKGRVISSEELFENVWGEKYIDANNTVSVHIWNLREKIETNPKEPSVIKTVWGVGYTLDG